MTFTLPFLTRRTSGRVPTRMDPQRRKKLFLSYLPDWIFTIGFAALFYGVEKIGSYKRQFSLEDTSLRHPYTLHERVPNPALVAICFVAPVVLLPIVNLLSVRSWWDLHTSYLGLILSLALTGSVTQIVKITVGRPRPDVIARCIPIPGSADPQYGLSTVDVCTQTDLSILDDGWRSFPSGHSSLSFAGLGFLSLYVAGKVHLFDRRGHAPKAWLAITPLCGAALVAISRTMDYRHHWQDVLVGSALGLLLAFFSYRQYYPSLAATDSHHPYSPRIRREAASDILPLHEAMLPRVPTDRSSGQNEVPDAYDDMPDRSYHESLDMTPPRVSIAKQETSILADGPWKQSEDARERSENSSGEYHS
ncbi:unnamed protein product [Somion occarium]|uniref:Phosphatidic acid phosphatase type 2/haloperoxidase domain-containing protein n=1 Tax=Somion occarium TaxID=3059160 RepID=A0ABP1DBW4_9APHY